MNFIKNKKGIGSMASILLIVVFSVLVIAGVTYFYNLDKNEKLIEKSIGGNKDEGGCLVGAGYSWCEIKNKCLRVWEEPCIEDYSQTKIETYLKENISILSPTKEVLGGKFHITRFRFTDNQQVVIDYEDGHNAFQASVIFSVDDEDIVIYKFSLLQEDDLTKSEENLGAFALLNEVFNQELKLDLKGRQVNSVEVIWNTENGEEKYLGYGHGISEVPESEKIDNSYRQIIKNLQNRGFKTDPYNAMSDSETFDQTRLKNGSVICNVIKKVIEEKENNKEVELRCADLKDSYSQGYKNWQIIKNGITNCQVESVMQTHSGRVSANFKDGRHIEAIQPEIDDIIDLAVGFQEECGEILMATE